MVVIRTERDDEHSRDADSTALAEAAYRGDLSTMRRLLDKGVDPVAARDQYDNSALDNAATSGQVGAIDLLVETGRYGIEELQRALFISILSGSPIAVEALLGHGASVATPVYEQLPPLHFAAAVVDRHAAGVDVIERLLAYHADPNACVGGGNAPLHSLALGLESKGRKPELRAKAARILLKAGALPAVENDAGDLPEGLARKKGFHALAEVLHKAMPKNPHTERPPER